ncbi:unnamed protein product [Parajaminaea phylloscopi]
MADPLEKSVLDGSFFRGPRTPSPTRTASTASEPSSSRSPSPVGDAAPKSNTVVQHSGPQTGPKGVRADRNAAVAHDRQQKRDELRKINSELKKLALEAGTWREQEKLAARQVLLREQLEDLENRAAGEESSGEDSDDNGDGDAVRRYRAQRIRELAGRSPAQNALQSTSQPRRVRGHYGSLIRVGASQYASAIDEVPPGTSVVVHIASDLVQMCLRLDSTLANLASQHPSTKFIRVRAIDIGFGLPEAASDDSDSEDQAHASPADRRLRDLEREEGVSDVVPTLLVYRDGTLAANLVRVDLEEDFGRGDEQDLERILRLHSALEEHGALSGGYAAGGFNNDHGDDDGDEDDDYDHYE